MSDIPKIFISYSHRDRKWLDRLHIQLAPTGREALLQVWDDTQMRAGTNWREEINRAIKEAAIGVLLVSPDFLASNFIVENELPPLLALTRVYWVLLRPCLWDLGKFAHLQAAHDISKPLSGLTQAKREQALTDIARKLLEEAKNVPTHLESRLGQQGTTSVGLFHVPYPRNRFFTGRKHYLQNLHNRVNSRGTDTLTQVIQGLGGIGKTQIALEYAYRYREEYKAVLWIQADTNDNIRAGYVEIASLLGLPESREADANRIVEAVKVWLANTPGYLLILDNADTPSLLESFLPENPIGHIVLTSRTYAFGHMIERMATPIAIKEMSADEAIKFLLPRSGRKNANPNEVKAAHQLTEALGYLPLALEQAAAYLLVNTLVDFGDYLRIYHLCRLELLEKFGPQTGNYKDTIRTTWSINFQSIERENVASVDILSVCAFLHSERIPIEIFLKGAGSFGPNLSSALEQAEGQKLALSELLEPLTRYSLIQVSTKDASLDIHRLVAEVVRERLTPLEQHLWAERTVNAVSEINPGYDDTTLLDRERLRPHWTVCEQHIDRFHLVSLTSVLLLVQAGRYLDASALYTEAIAVLQKAVGIAEEIPEGNETAMLVSYINLAELYQELGEYDLAIELYNKVSPLIKTFGPESKEASVLFNNLAGLYTRTFRFEEATSLYQDALDIRRKIFGDEYPDTVSTASNLAALHITQGHYAEAEALLVTSIASLEKAYGKEHPAIVFSLEKLASLRESQYRYAEAEPLRLRTVRIREKLLGEEHPDTALSMGNLAQLYWLQGRYDEATKLITPALSVIEKVLGPQHPHTLSLMGNLGHLYISQGNYAEAEQPFKTVIAHYENVESKDQAHLIPALNGLTLVYRQQHSYLEAETYAIRALDIAEKTYGINHPDVALLLGSLAYSYVDQAQFDKAEPLFARALAIKEEVFGKEHQVTKDALVALLKCYIYQDQWDKAEELAHRATVDGSE